MTITMINQKMLENCDRKVGDGEYVEEHVLLKACAVQAINEQQMRVYLAKCGEAAVRNLGG